VGVPLAATEVAGFYQRYANGVLWPALHDERQHPLPEPADWAMYQTVNERFADTVAAHMRPGDEVWIHDYHLMLVPRLLRDRCPDARIGFFLHTPFPSLESLVTVPQRAALLDGLLGADVVGFHTRAYAARFVDAVRAVLGHRGYANDVEDGERRVHVRACPMGIDFATFDARAADPRVASHVERLRREGGSLLVGVDRLDYTKGIPERLDAFERLLARSPELCGRVRLFQLAVPSREKVPAYRALRARVESLVARINARFGTPTWTPVEYVYGSVDALTLSAIYRAADVMLVTPLRDGMNLVAKEFVASRPDGDGVLVLSERAGAAAELRAALLVDPTDTDGLARAYETALALPAAERRVRMRRMRACVQRHDVFQWARECLLALGSEHAALVGRTAG
jgi:trehalose 6-phosphate synthase/phosphatase